jgi:hypothetical protein
VTARPRRARPSPVNRPNVEAAPGMPAPKYQKNATVVKGLRCSEEEQDRNGGGEPEAVIGKGAQ